MASSSPQSPSSEPSVGHKAVKGMAWLMVQSLSGRLTAFISQLLLAKLLLPEDFGVLGLAYTISTIFSVFTNVGIDQVVQQRSKNMRFWTTQGFLISLGLTLLMGLAMAIYAPFGAENYHNEKVIPLVLILALSLPLNALATLPVAKLQAEMRFKFLALYNSFDLMGTQALTILLAWLHFGALSFVLPIPFMALLRAIVYWSLAPSRFLPLSRAKGWLMILKRGTASLTSRLALALIDQGDYLMLGFFTSAHVLGTYFFAFRLAIQPVKIIAGNFSNVLFPALLSQKDNPQKQAETALRSSELLGFSLVPLMIMQAALAEPFIRLLFGAKWDESIILIQILSLGLSLDAISWPPGTLMAARGQFSRVSKYQIAFLPLFYLFVTLGAWIGSAKGVALGVAAYYMIHPISFSLLVFRKEKIERAKVIRSYLLPFLMSLASIGPFYALSCSHVLRGETISQIGLTGSLGILAYGVSLRFVRPDVYNDICLKLRRLLPGNNG